MRIVFYVQRGLFGIQDSIIKAILGNLARVVSGLQRVTFAFLPHPSTRVQGMVCNQSFKRSLFRPDSSYNGCLSWF
jgi:hypothetical protein